MLILCAWEKKKRIGLRAHFVVLEKLPGSEVWVAGFRKGRETDLSHLDSRAVRRLNRSSDSASVHVPLVHVVPADEKK